MYYYIVCKAEYISMLGIPRENILSKSPMSARRESHVFFAGMTRFNGVTKSAFWKFHSAGTYVIKLHHNNVIKPLHD